MEKQQSEVRSYRDLLVWKKGIELTKAVYLLTKQFPGYEIYGLASQIQRAAVSVPSNIAEGQSRQSAQEFSHFIRIALGSLAEIDTQLTLAYELGYLCHDEEIQVMQMVIDLRKMLFGLLNHLPNRKTGG